jgi:SSS family solute:Na+ symporter
MLVALDKGVIVAYLLMMVLLGFQASRVAMENIYDYAIGRSRLHQYSTFTLLCTVLATDFGAGSTLGDAGKIFKMGLGFFVIKLTLPLMYLVVSEKVAPLMRPFLSETLDGPDTKAYVSVGDIMCRFYGRGAQWITGLAGLLACIGVIAAQVSAIGWLLNYCFGWSYFLGVGLSFGVVMLYAVLGGVRGVVRTDAFQLILMVVGIAIMLIINLSLLVGYSDYEYWIACVLGIGLFMICLGSFDLPWVSPKSCIRFGLASCLIPLGVYVFGGQEAPSSALLNLSKFFHLHKLAPHLARSHFSLIPLNMGLADFLALWVLMVTPFLRPAMVQRLLMARRVELIRDSYRIGAGVQVILCCMVACAGFAGAIQYPDAEPMSVLLRVVQGCGQPGLYGICVVGILAAIMSTADSYLNVASVCFSHDICKTLMGRTLSDAAEVRLARGSMLFIGFFAAFIALYCVDIRDLLIASLDAWGPVVVVPLWAGLLGFRARPKAFWVAVLVGQLVYWGYPLCQPAGIKIAAAFPAMVSSAVAFTLMGRLGRHMHQTPQLSPRPRMPLNSAKNKKIKISLDTEA